jgi:hypothetical protein
VLEELPMTSWFRPAISELSQRGLPPKETIVYTSGDKE